MIDVIERPVTRKAVKFVPVIFANGEDDDAPGIEAALRYKEVQFDERIYQPAEHIHIFGRHIVVSRDIRCMGEPGLLKMTIENCFVQFRP